MNGQGVTVQNPSGLTRMQVEGMFGGFDTMMNGLPMETRQRMEQMLSTSADAEQDKAQWANAAFLADAYKKPVPEIAGMIDAYREDYARQMFHVEQPLDDKAFYNRVGQFYQQRKDERVMLNEIRGRMAEAFAAGAENWRAPLTSVLAEFKGKPGYDAARLDIYQQLAEGEWNRWMGAGDQYFDAVEAVGVYLKQWKTRSGTEEEGLQARQAAIRALEGVPDDQQAGVIALANRLTGKADAEGPGGTEKLAGRLERGIGTFAREAVTGLADILSTSPEWGGSPELVAARQAGRKIERRLDQALLGSSDPYKGSDWLSEGVLAATQGLPAVMAMFHPAGMLANLTAFSEEARGRFEDAGVPEDKAQGMGLIAAIPLTALQLVNTQTIIGRAGTQAVEAWALRNIAGKEGVELVSGYAKNLVAQAAETTAVLGASSAGTMLTEPAIQSLASIMDGTIPGVDWAKELKGLAKATPEALAQLVPLIALGTGAATFRTRGRALDLALVQDEARLDALGFTPEAKAAVMAADSPQEALAAMREGWESRVQNEAALLEYNAQIAAMEGEGGGQEQGRTPRKPRFRVSLAPDGGFLVKDEAGNIVGQHASPEMAARQAGKATLRQLPEGVDITPLGKKYLVAEGVGEPVEQWQIKMPGESGRGRTLTAEQLAAEGFAPPEVRQPSVPATPEVDGAPLPQRVSALNKAEIVAFREMFGLDKLDKPQRERFEQVLDSAKAKDLDKSAEALAEDILARPRMVSAEEHAGLLLRTAELQNQFEQTMTQAAAEIAAGNTERGADLQRIASNVLASLDAVTEAADLAGTEIGRALSARRMRVNRDTYELAATIQRARLAKGAELTPEQTVSFQKLTEQIKEQDTKIAKLEADLAKQEKAAREAQAKTFVQEGRARRRVAAGTRAAARRVEYKRQLAKLGYRVNDVTGIVGLSAEAATIIAKIADTYIEEGIATLPDLVARLQKEIPDLSEQDIYNSVGRRTQAAKKQIEGEAKTRIKELRTQARLVAQINDALKGQFDKAEARKKDSPAVAALRKQLGELRLQADRVVREDAQLKRIHEKINAVQAQLEGGYRTLQNREGEAAKPEAIKVAEEKLRALKDEMAAIDRALLAPQAAAEAALKSLAKRYSDIQEWPKKKSDVVREAIKEQHENPKPVEEFQALLERLGVDEAVAGPLAEAVQMDINARQRRAEIGEAERRAEYREGLKEKIAELQSQIEGGYRNIPEAKPRRSVDIDVSALKKEIGELERLLRTEDAIADLEEQLRTGDFKVSAPEERIIKNAELEAALVKRQQLRREVNNEIEKLKANTLARAVEGGANLARALKVTADMGALLRQGVFQLSRLAFTDPAKAASIVANGVRAFFSQYSADAIDIAIRRHENQLERDRAGLHLSSLDATPTAREEMFSSNLIERIPVLGEIAKASNRNMTTVLNLLRADAFDRILASHPTATPAQKKALAEWINISTGRGNLGKFSRAGKTLAQAFFAPRFFVSRFQVFSHPMKHIKDPVVRKEIAKDWLAFLGAGTTALMLAALAGAEVGLDPESSDFGKIVWGDTRIDVWGGLQQPARLSILPLLATLDSAGIRETQKQIDLIDAGRRFLSYKLSPAVTLPAELATRRNIVGQEREIDETLLRAITPLIIEQTAEVYRNTGDPVKTAVTGGLGFVGVGVSEQEPR